jgi:YbbR domain-containing protein
MPFRMHWLTRNFGLKLVSLVIAIGFWFYVVGEESIEITKTVPFEIQTSNEKMSIAKTSTSFLEVTFHTPRHLLSVLSSSETPARHVIDSVDKAGDYSFNVSAKDILLPAPEIRVDKIFPSFVTVALDEVIVKKLPIRVDLIDEPAFGYRVDEEGIELDPIAVLVEGPKAVLEKMDAIPTEPVQLVGRIRSFRRKVRIRNLPEVKPLGEGTTEVQIPVIAEFSEKELPNVPVKPLGIPASGHYVKLAADQVSVMLKGPRALLEKLAQNDILAFVPVDGLKGGAHEVPVQFILPSDLAIKGEPPLVIIEVNKLKIKA